MNATTDLILVCLNAGLSVAHVFASVWLAHARHTVLAVGFAAMALLWGATGALNFREYRHESDVSAVPSTRELEVQFAEYAMECIYAARIEKPDWSDAARLSLCSEVAKNRVVERYEALDRLGLLDHGTLRRLNSVNN